MIQDFKDKYKGETAILIGNGPSLNDTPLAELAKKYPLTFGANKIYELPFTPSFWTCGDSLMLAECISWVFSHPEFDSEKFVPSDIPLSGSHGMNLQVGIGFSKDPSRMVWMGGTVSYINMQLAKYMGFTRLLLVGIDHRYSKSEKGGRPGSKFIADGDDPDHFGKGYFSAGRVYNRPELEAIEKYFYPLAKKELDIINLTPNSAEHVFKKDDISKWI